MQQTLRMECPSHPEVSLIEDWTAGDLICPECGLVVGDRVLDVNTTWRQAKSADADVDYFHYYTDIEEMAEKLNLPNSIGRLAKKLQNSKVNKFSDDMAAACLYATAKNAQTPRTFSEIAAVCGASRRQIQNAFNEIKLLVDRRFASPKHYIARFGSRLDLSFKEIKAAESLADSIEELHGSPVTVAAAVLYVISDCTIDQVSIATGVTKSCLRRMVKIIESQV